jgi:hypothetical protein
MNEIKRQDNQEEYDSIVFVCKARLKENKKKPYTTVIHVEQTIMGSRLVATDGKRLHVAEIKTRIKNGNYRPVITKDSISFGKPVTGLFYPNWNSVIPENPRKRLTIDLEKTGMGKDRKLTAFLSEAYSVFTKKTGEIVNLGYLEDLTKTTWTVYKEPGKFKPILLKPEGEGNKKYAVIMPMGVAA